MAVMPEWGCGSNPSVETWPLAAGRQLLPLFRMQLLQGVNFRLAALEGRNALAGGARGRKGGDGGNMRGHSRATDCLLVKPGLDPMRRVDDQLNAFALDQVNDIRSPFFHLVDTLDAQAGVLQDARRPMSSNNAESQLDEAARQFRHEGLVAIVTAEEDRTRRRQQLSRGGLRLPEG